MKTEIASLPFEAGTSTVTPDQLVLDTRVPFRVVEWCFRRGEPRVSLTMTASGLNCSVKSGALELEFDAIGSGRPLADRARDELLRAAGRQGLSQVGGSLAGATLAAGGAA